MALSTKQHKNDKIFVCYRRSDSPGFAGRVSDTLSDYFGKHRIYRDVKDIKLAVDYKDDINKKLAECGAVLVLIGHGWLDAEDADGKRRLDDPKDDVAHEIATALQTDVTVLPVLIGDTVMPGADQLPEKLEELPRRNAITITDERWDFDMSRLAKVLSIDVPGSVAQRNLDVLKAVALSLILVAGLFATIRFCQALNPWPPDGGLKALGYSPLVSAVPFIGTLLAGTVAGFKGAPLMEESKRKFAWSATFVSYAGTLAIFVVYTTLNVSKPNVSLMINFGASVITMLIVLTLISLAGFKAE